MVTTEGERGLGGRTTHQEKLRMSLVNVKLGVQKQVNKGKTPRKPNTPKKRGNLIKQSMCSMWSEEGIEIPLVIFNNKDKHKVQRQRERRDSRKALLDCIGRWACVLVGFASTEAMFRKLGLSKRATGWARGPTLSPSAARKKSLTLLLVNHCFRLFLLWIVLNLTFIVQVFYSIVLYSKVSI